MAYCPGCGTENEGSSAFCKNCGKPLTAGVQAPPPEQGSPPGEGGIPPPPLPQPPPYPPRGMPSPVASGFGYLPDLSLIHISEPTRLGMISYAVFCLKKKK